VIDGSGKFVVGGGREQAQEASIKKGDVAKEIGLAEAEG
jgi:hypothetical protein